MNEVCCEACKHFEERTKFCRLSPPAPIVVVKNLDNGEQVRFVESKFPVIPFPKTDYCSEFSGKIQGLPGRALCFSKNYWEKRR